MTELDDLRRIAYGRTSTPAEEAAAAEARAVLAERLAPTVVDVAPAESDPKPVEPDTLTIVDVRDEAGYVRRLAATWRVWAGPAFVAFVFGIVLTVASGVLVLNSVVNADRYDGADITVDESVEVSGPGDLEAATAVLGRPRDSQDLIAELDSSIDSESTRLLRSMSSRSAYAATSESGEICLIVVSGPIAIDTACVPPSAFPTQGLTVTLRIGSATESVHWDGVDVSEAETVNSAG